VNWLFSRISKFDKLDGGRVSGNGDAIFVKASVLLPVLSGLGMNLMNGCEKKRFTYIDEPVPVSQPVTATGSTVC
jgi:hypothetical protein